MLVWLQHSDFTTDEFPNATLEMALDTFITFNWPAEWKQKNNARESKEEYADPGIGLVRGDAHILHICPDSHENASVFYHYKEPAKVLGLIPYLSSETIHAYEFPMTSIRELFEAHFGDDHAATVLLLNPHT